MKYLVLFLGLPLLALAASPGVELFDQKRFPEAEAEFRSRVAANARDAEAVYYLGRIAAGRQDYEAAMTQFERAASLEAANAEYQFQYGAACLQEAGRAGMSLRALSLSRKGRSAMEKSVELQPGNAVYRQGLIDFYFSAPGIAGGGVDKAYAQVAELERHHPRAGKIARVQLLTREKKNAEAFALGEELLRDRPEDYQVLYLLGRLSAETGQSLDRGIAALETCLRIDPPAGLVGHTAVNRRLGEARLRKGDEAGARAAFEAALSLDPNYEPARAALAKLGRR